MVLIVTTQPLELIFIYFLNLEKVKSDYEYILVAMDTKHNSLRLTLLVIKC